MSMVTFPSVVVIHRPNGEDLLLRNRVVSAKGKYGLRLGSNQFRPGSATLTLSNYDDLIDPVGENLTPEELQECTVTIGIGTYSLFNGRVRSVKTKQLKRRTDVTIVIHDALAELAGGIEVELPPKDPITPLQERSGDRLNRILDWAGWPGSSAYRFIDQGEYFCLPNFTSLEGTEEQTPQATRGKLIDLLRQVATTEWARFGVAHARKLVDRVYNRGKLIFIARDPVVEEWIHIDNSTPTLSGNSLRSASPLILEPDKRDLINTVRVQAANPGPNQEGVIINLMDVNSVRRYGAQEYAPRHKLLCGADDANHLATWILGIFSEPRTSYRNIMLKPYLSSSRALCERVYRLSVDKSVRVTGSQANNPIPLSTVHRVDEVMFDLKPGDNNLIDDEGNFAGGAICDITLSLQIPEASAYWKYSVRGASELGRTTLFAPRQPEDDFINLDDTPDPYSFEEGTLITAPLWNEYMINKSFNIYPTEEDRDSLRAKGALRQGIEEPPDGQMTMISSRLWLQAFNANTRSDQLIAQVETRGAPGTFTFDDPNLSRLDYGNLLREGDSNGN